MTTFKAVDGHIHTSHVEHLTKPHATAHVTAISWSKFDLPCTIISGHWAERIEKGELLSEAEEVEMWQEWPFATAQTYTEFVVRFIARKLRGEA